jgi:hypothetical protein
MIMKGSVPAIFSVTLKIRNNSEEVKLPRTQAAISAGFETYRLWRKIALSSGAII